MEVLLINPIILSECSFGLIPEVLNAIDVIVFSLGKMRGVIDAVMMELRHIKRIIAAIAIRIDNAVRHDFLPNDGHQRVGLGVVNDLRVNAIPAFQDAKNNDLSGSAATTFAFAVATKIRFIQLDFPAKHFFCLQGKLGSNHLPDFMVKQCRRVGLDTHHIRRRSRRYFQNKKLQQTKLCLLR